MKNPSEKYKMHIPNNDMPGWIEALRSSDLSEEEIKGVLSYLNQDYKKLINPAEKELEKLEKYLKENYNKTLSEEQRDYLRKQIEERLRQQFRA